jgi:hypothetical protein
MTLVVALLSDPGDPTGKSANGALGLVVVLFLAAALVVLVRSMTKHLRKAQLMKAEEQQAEAEGRIDPPRT